MLFSCKRKAELPQKSLISGENLPCPKGGFGYGLKKESEMWFQVTDVYLFQRLFYYVTPPDLRPTPMEHVAVQ